MERWNPIPGFESYYEASASGQVRSLDRIVKHPLGDKRLAGRVLSRRVNASGYFGVILCGPWGRKPFDVHRLVALAFIPNEENLAQVNHKNGIKSDCSVENLEWVTQTGNRRHRSTKMTMEKAEQMRLQYREGVNYLALMELFGVCQTTVHRILKCEIWNPSLA